MRDARLKAVIPGGSSAKVLRADEMFKLKEKQTDGTTIEHEMPIDQIPLDFDSLAAAGSMAGSGGVIVLDDSRDMVWALNNINEFYAHESCGQCTPCREGSLWMKKITDRMLLGGGVQQDPTTLKNVADNIAGRTICAFGEACAWPTQSFVEKFPDEFAARANKPTPPPLPPEYTPNELIDEPSIPTTSPRPRSRLGKSRHGRNNLNGPRQSSPPTVQRPDRRHVASVSERHARDRGMRAGGILCAALLLSQEAHLSRAIAGCA